MNYLIFKRLSNRNLIPILLGIILALILPSCQNNPVKDENKEMPDCTVSENSFQSVPDSDKPWVYYWWLKRECYQRVNYTRPGRNEGERGRRISFV